MKISQIRIHNQIFEQFGVPLMQFPAPNSSRAALQDSSAVAVSKRHHGSCRPHRHCVQHIVFRLPVCLPNALWTAAAILFTNLQHTLPRLWCPDPCSWSPQQVQHTLSSRPTLQRLWVQNFELLQPATYSSPDDQMCYNYPYAASPYPTPLTIFRLHGPVHIYPCHRINSISRVLRWNHPRICAKWLLLKFLLQWAVPVLKYWNWPTVLISKCMLETSYMRKSWIQYLPSCRLRRTIP